MDRIRLLLASTLLVLCAPQQALASDSGVDRLVAALLGDTPLIADLRSLTDEIGGRPTGSESNLRAVRWGGRRCCGAR